MDETGHSGDAGAADGGTGAESRDRTLLNGWAARESPWSNAGSALDPETEVPAWRRPATEIRPFTQERPPPAEPPSGEIRPFTMPPPPPSFSPAPEPQGRPSPLENAAAPRWSDSRSRYEDLLAHLSPNGGEPRDDDPRQNESPRAGLPRPDPLAPELLRPDEGETTELRAVNGNLPASAPPYPYEGDLDDARQEPPRPQAGQQRAAVPAERPFPAVRPAAPGGRRADWATSESARHALDPPTPLEGLPRVAQPMATDESRSGDQGTVRPSYDPSSFPRRLPYEPTDTPAGYAQPPAFPGEPGPGSTGEQSFPALPQRVPAQPDVPTVPEPPSVEPPAETPALARTATHLRRGDVLSAQERQEGFDVNAILAAVREVDGVRDASLRSTPAGAHSLRLDLSEGADPAEVSRQVARLLQDRMGLDAAMKGASPLSGPAEAPSAARPAAPAPRSAPPAYSGSAPASAPPVAPASAPPSAQASAPPITPFVPSQPNPTGRPVPAPGSYTSASRQAPDELTRPASRPDPDERRPFDELTRPDERRPSDELTRPSERRPADELTYPGERQASDELTRPGERQASDELTRPGERSTAGQRPYRSDRQTAEERRSPTERSRLSERQGERQGLSDRQGVSDRQGLGERQGLGDRPAARQGAGNRQISDERPASNERPVPSEAPTSVEPAPPRPLDIGERPGPRVMIENVRVNTFGTEATVEVRLTVNGQIAAGEATGPAVDGYLLRLCAMATARAVDELLTTSDHADGPAKCFVEHAAAVPFGSMQVAVVVMLLSVGGWVEQLSGSAVITGDDRHAMVRATLNAVNRRLEALLS
ncbi:hypothetical protein Aau02nite_13080 [Amorphoplanes auranticolor]|uniref:Uncharacterized protein n=1 Tax=Actinoplanes auranticolor TaxID=47988 RepID=A0A919S6I9_9ACTN|nr:hypothetical protein [Actinoplanes auranticolor]GIM64850.1 hypothetical protein Aau02nite_13080 [Actinoplanes auranticolor]